MLGVSMGFYLFFAFYDGAVICVDSPTYINWESSREPLYPLFLALLRFLLGAQGRAIFLGWFCSRAFWLVFLLLRFQSICGRNAG